MASKTVEQLEKALATYDTTKEAHRKILAVRLESAFSSLFQRAWLKANGANDATKVYTKQIRRVVPKLSR